MKPPLLMLPLLFLLAGCGRTYTLIGKIVFLDTTASSITEVVGNSLPPIGAPIAGATITLFHELRDNHSVRDSTWRNSVTSDKAGHFRLSDYAAPGKENLVGLEVTAAGYDTVFTTYVDYSDPDEQYFFGRSAQKGLTMHSSQTRFAGRLSSGLRLMPTLSEDQYKTTFAAPMRQLPPDAEPAFDFGPYFDAIPASDFAGHECKGDVTYVWEDASARFQHVLFNSQDKNVFMVLVLDLSSQSVAGHRLLDLNEMYGLDEA